ncbi:uncharacterized protein LOC129583055 isoform X2 [Paramacrobiotus metropolitanus]|nr:uncharacterized protein LOC129583055 isoform X2 [Paramacrobiotus metropolitanus]XP_055330727.1 uncharacterized protein LOC129583055 isoform X2 [Paramacrobiotus metropolitanus]
MGIKTFFTSLLDKKLYSSYPEILLESALVLWFVCQICLKFGLQILPEWRSNRLDADKMNAFDYWLELSGLKVDACFWDGAMSGWIQQNSTVASLESNGTSEVLPLSSTGMLGYVVTLVTIVLAAILSISLVFLAVVNRQWKYSSSKDQLPYFRRWKALIQKSIGCAAEIHLPDKLLIVVYVLIGIVSFVVYYPGWVIFNALTVLLAWVFVTLAINVSGPSAVFPGCILFASILAVYCTGRIWGLWMNDTYGSLVIKGFRKLTSPKSTEKPSSSWASVKKEVAGSDRNQGRGRWRRAACCMVAFCIGCFVVYHNVWPLFKQFPLVHQWMSSSCNCKPGSGNWTYWRVVNTTGSCNKAGTRFSQETTMLSYWVDLQSHELRTAPSGNSELLISFTPSFSPAVGWTYLVWCGVLSGASGIVVITLRYAIWSMICYIVLWVLWLLLRSGVRACHKKYRRYVSTERSRNPDYRKQSQLLNADDAAQVTAALHNAPSAGFPESSIDETSVCTAPSDHLQGNTIANPGFLEAKGNRSVQVAIECAPQAPTPKDADQIEDFLGEIWGYRKLPLLLVICPLFCGWVLPYPLVGLFLPERLQLPGLLLLLTACSIWMYCKLVQFVRLTWRDWCCCAKKLEGCCVGGKRAGQSSPDEEECVRLS